MPNVAETAAGSMDQRQDVFGSGSPRASGTVRRTGEAAASHPILLGQAFWRLHPPFGNEDPQVRTFEPVTPEEFWACCFLLTTAKRIGLGNDLRAGQGSCAMRVPDLATLARVRAALGHARACDGKAAVDACMPTGAH